VATVFQGVAQGMKRETSPIQDIAALMTTLHSQNNNNNNNDLIMQWMQMQQAQRKEDQDRFQQMMAEMADGLKSDPLAELERVDELRAKLSAKTVNAPPPPITTDAGGALEKALDIAGKFLERGSTAPPIDPTPQLPPTDSQSYDSPTVESVAEEEAMEPEPMDFNDPVEELKQADMLITQNIINMADPLSVITDISKLVTWAKEEGLLEHIEEVVEANYQIEGAFELYIRTRSTNPPYTEKLLSAAQAFLPLVKEYKLRDEVVTESGSVSPDSLSVAEESQQAEAV